MNTATRISTALAALLMITGCATVQMADPRAQDEIKQFKIPPGLTDLCFVKPKTFVQAWVKPDERTIQMKNDGIADMHSPKITVETASSDTRFLWIGVTGGGMGTYSIDHIEIPQAGMRCVQDAAYSVAR
jgi:hypothetical protein